MRRTLVAGNWKMNMTLASARDLAGGIRQALAGFEAVDCAVCPPAVYLLPVAEALAGSTIRVGAQDIYFEEMGAFTGEISASMAMDVGARFAILGHSERRHTIGHLEDDWMINRKVRAAMAAGLTPILCVGETLAQREARETLAVLTFQIRAGLATINPASADQLVIAYEPVWAIGTGHNATPDQAQEAHAHIRNDLRELYGGLADEIRILYGGSMKPDNAAALLSQPDVDGGLIGGASLKTDSFVGIVRAAPL